MPGGIEGPAGVGEEGAREGLPRPSGSLDGLAADA